MPFTRFIFDCPAFVSDVVSNVKLFCVEVEKTQGGVKLIQ